MNGRNAVRPSIAAIEVAQAKRTVEELPGRLSTARSLEAQAMMLRTAVELTRQLVAKRDAGVPIEADTIERAFEALDEGLGRMLELMPAESRR